MLSKEFRAPNGNMCTAEDVIVMGEVLIMMHDDIKSGKITADKALNELEAMIQKGLPVECAFAQKVDLEKLEHVTYDLRKEALAYTLAPLARLNSIKNGTTQPPTVAQSYTALNGRVCTKEQVLEIADTLQKLREGVALGRITEAKQAQVIRSMSAAGVPLICATATLQAAKDEARKAIEAIKTKIIEKNLALPGIGAVIMASVEGTSRSGKGNITSLAQEVIDTIFLGDSEKFGRRAEHFTKRCLRQNEPRHLCFSMNQANGAASRLAAAGPAALAAHWAQVDHDIRVNQASGAC